MLVQAKGGPQVVFTGIVDSGAGRFGDASEASVYRFGRTVLSLKDAENLGLSKSDLKDAGTVTVADESQVTCLTPLIPIRAQVLEPSSGSDPAPWGPVFLFFGDESTLTAPRRAVSTVLRPADRGFGSVGRGSSFSLGSRAGC